MDPHLVMRRFGREKPDQGNAGGVNVRCYKIMLGLRMH
jgi:hypothetical protein